MRFVSAGAACSASGSRPGQFYRRNGGYSKHQRIWICGRPLVLTTDPVGRPFGPRVDSRPRNAKGPGDCSPDPSQTGVGRTDGLHPPRGLKITP